MFRRTRTELPDRVAQNDGNRPPFKQRGIANVELAIAVPVLLLLLCVAAEAGRWLYQYNTLHKAVRDGVRNLANVAITGTTGVVNLTGSKAAATRCLVVYGTAVVANDGSTCTGTDPVLEGLTSDDIAVAPVGNNQVNVSATYDYNPIFALGIPTFGLGGGPINFDIDMTASATMRAL